MIHLNIRHAKKNLEKLTDFLPQTWFDNRNSEVRFTICQKTVIHQYRSLSNKSGRGGWYRHVHP